MAKRTITQWWIWGFGIMVVGAILATIMSLVTIAHIGDATVGFRYSYIPDSFFWTMIGFMTLCGIAIICGIGAQLVAWIGAVINTNRLEDKAWFNLLLIGGIVGIAISPLVGLGALFWLALMVCYLVVGPDGLAVQPPIATRAEPSIATPAEPPKILLPTG